MVKILRTDVDRDEFLANLKQELRSMEPWKHTLHYGDSLNILRDYLADESVDRIYLDPPFNANRSYAVSAGFYHSAN